MIYGIPYSVSRKEIAYGSSKTTKMGPKTSPSRDPKAPSNNPPEPNQGLQSPALSWEARIARNPRNSITREDIIREEKEYRAP